DMLTYSCIFRRMIKTFQPAQVADMDHITDARSQFHKHSIWRDVFHQAIMLAALREFGFDSAPRIFTELFDGEAHLARILVECHDAGLVFITQFEKFLGIDGGIGPGDFAHMHQTFHTRHYFKKSAIVFDIHYPAFHNFSFLHILRKHIPWMRGELFQTEADPLLAIIEIEYHHLEFLIQFQHFARMTDASPADIGNV